MMVFWHIDTRIDCCGPYCIPVPKAILAVGKNLSKRWLCTTEQEIIEMWVGHYWLRIFHIWSLWGRRMFGLWHIIATLLITKWIRVLRSCVTLIYVIHSALVICCVCVNANAVHASTFQHPSGVQLCLFWSLFFSNLLNDFQNIDKLFLFFVNLSNDTWRCVWEDTPFSERLSVSSTTRQLHLDIIIGTQDEIWTLLNRTSLFSSLSFSSVMFTFPSCQIFQYHKILSQGVLTDMCFGSKEIPVKRWENIRTYETVSLCRMCPIW